MGPSNIDRRLHGGDRFHNLKALAFQRTGNGHPRKVVVLDNQHRSPKRRG